MEGKLEPTGRIGGHLDGLRVFRDTFSKKIHNGRRKKGHMPNQSRVIFISWRTKAFAPTNQSESQATGCRTQPSDSRSHSAHPTDMAGREVVVIKLCLRWEGGNMCPPHYVACSWLGNNCRKIFGRNWNLHRQIDKPLKRWPLIICG